MLQADTLEFMRDRDVRRFTSAYDQDRVVIDTTLKLSDPPKWDNFENNHFAMRRRLVAIWLKAANLLITRNRAGKRLAKIKQKLKQEGVKSRADARRFVVEDWKNALNIKVVENEAEDNIENIKFRFTFSLQAVQSAQMKLPLEYETNIASFMEKVEANPPINFDDLASFDHVEPLDFEIQKYQKIPLAQVSTFDPLDSDKIFRPGCEYESILKQRRGEPDLEKLQFSAFEQQKLLRKDKKDIVSGAIVNMPKTFLKPLDYSIDLLVRAHPTLRDYTDLSR